MKDASPQTIRLADYQPPSHLVEEVALTFRLAPRATRVLSSVRFTPNPARPDALAGRADLRLDGENLRLISAAIDGAPLDLGPDATGLTVPAALLPDGPFTCGRPRSRSRPRTTPRWRGSTCRAACTAPSARPRAFARSPSTPTAPT